MKFIFWCKDCEYYRASMNQAVDLLNQERRKARSFIEGVIMELKENDHPLNGACKGHSIIIQGDRCCDQVGRKVD